MTEKIVGAQYSYSDSLSKKNEWRPLGAVELITPEETAPNSLDSLAQGLNTLVTDHGMATVASALQKWVDFHSKEQK